MRNTLEVKGTLAKLLATEDLIVEHRDVSTAQFNVQTRVLTLPNWKSASNQVLDLLISHEVGHALFTPNVDWTQMTKNKLPQMFLNVTEDARIEMLMKRKFAGLPKTFYKGYKELFEDDFFGIEGENISDLTLADRVNLYFKVGHFLPITFSEEEKVVVTQISNAQTFEEAIEAAEALYALHKKQKEEQQKQEELAPQPNGKEQTESKSEDTEEQPEMEGQDQDQGEGEGEEEGESDEVDMEDQPTDEGGDHFEMDEDIVKTMENMDEKLQDLTSSGGSYNVYLTHPKIDMNHIVIDNKSIHDVIHAYWHGVKNRIANSPERESVKKKILDDYFTRHEISYAKFKKEIQSEVNYLVKEFECKKSADAYARASVSKTGVLDCAKIHSYKYNEDLFKKVTTIPDGKNHGLVFVLDWSGSMRSILRDTMKQLLSLVMFCDKVNIPFDVYAFTNEWRHNMPMDQEEYRASLTPNQIYIDNRFSMMNILTSRSSRKNLNEQMKTMYMIANMYHRCDWSIIPDQVSLSGTPLNEALFSLHEIIPEFQARNNVQKVHSIILTDGEAAGSAYVKSYEDHYDRNKTKNFPSRVTEGYLRNRKTGVCRLIHGYNFTDDILRDLCETFPNSTFTGFRLIVGNPSHQLRQLTGYDEKKMAEWRKYRMIALDNTGYTRYFLIQSSKLQSDVSFEVDENASKAKIKNAFSKSLKGKKNNKRILGDFIELIA